MSSSQAERLRKEPAGFTSKKKTGCCDFSTTNTVVKSMEQPSGGFLRCGETTMYRPVGENKWTRSMLLIGSYNRTAGMDSNMLTMYGAQGMLRM
jgi:hypothetical protein